MHTSIVASSEARIRFSSLLPLLLPPHIDIGIRACHPTAMNLFGQLDKIASWLGERQESFSMFRAYAGPSTTPRERRSPMRGGSSGPCTCRLNIQYWICKTALAHKASITPARQGEARLGGTPCDGHTNTRRRVVRGRFVENRRLPGSRGARHDPAPVVPLTASG